MLFFLDEPRTLLAIAVALLLGIVLHGVVQTLVAGALGDRTPRAAGRLSPDPRRHFEPFGVVVMLIAVIGWGRPVPLAEPRFASARPRYLLALLSGALTHFAIALLAMAGFALAGGGTLLEFGGTGRGFAGDLLAVVALVNVLLGVLSLVPLPPLDGARILWALAPRTPGWQKARYHLEEQNFGLAIAFVLLLPIFGNVGLLWRVVEAVGRPLLRLMASLVGVSFLY